MVAWLAGPEFEAPEGWLGAANGRAESPKQAVICHDYYVSKHYDPLVTANILRSSTTLGRLGPMLGDERPNEERNRLHRHQPVPNLVSFHFLINSHYATHNGGKLPIPILDATVPAMNGNTAPPVAVKIDIQLTAPPMSSCGSRRPVCAMTVA